MPFEKPRSMKDFYAVFSGQAFLLPTGLSAGLTLHLWKWLRLSSHLSEVRDSPKCCLVEPIRI